MAFKRSRKINARKVHSNARKAVKMANSHLLKSKPIAKALAKSLTKIGVSKKTSQKLASRSVSKLRKSMLRDPKYKRFLSKTIASSYLKSKRSH